MKAMILAAGRGERLNPITQELPKPLVPVANLPIIRYNIEFLKHYGFNDICINVYHLPKQIEQELGDGSVLGVKLTYSYEEELWGTGGGLKQVEDFFKDEEFFVMMNADILIDCDLEDAIHFHRRNDAIATMILTQDAPVSTYGAVEIDDANLIRNIAGRIDDVRETDRIPAVFTGIHILTPRIFEYIPPNINTCINQYAYPKMVQNKEKVMGYMMEGFWADIGKPETYFSTNMLFLDRRVNFRHYDPLAHFTLKPDKETSELVCLGENVELGIEIDFKPPIIVGHNVRIGDKATIGPYVVIGDGCTIGKNAVVTDSVILPMTKVGNKQTVTSQVLDHKRKLKIDSSASNTQILEAMPDDEAEE